jgi:hypothetical protein
MCLAYAMKNALQSARLVHWALVIVCAALIALALASTTAQQYSSALHWLLELSKVDLDKWAKMVENRQSVALSGPLMVEPVLEQEAERVRLPVKKGRIVWEQVAIRVHPSVSEVRNATMETLLSSIFRNVETPQLFYPGEQSLRRSLRELFSEQVVDSAQRFVLSRAVLVFETARDAPGKALLRLEWYANADAVGVTPPAVTRDLPLDGAYKYEAYDFDHFIRVMNPELLKPSLTQRVVEGKQSWSAGVREQLSPIWGEIKDKTLAAAYAHVQTQLNEAKGNVTLFGLTIYRQQMLVFGSVALLILLCAMMFSVRRLDAATVLGFPGAASFPEHLAPALTFLSTVALPITTFGYIIVRFGEARLSGETVVSGLAAGVGAICALLSYRWILDLRRPQLSEADRKRVELAKAQVASFGRAALRPSRVLGRVLLAIGFIAGPVGAATFSLYLIGLGIGSQASGVLPLLAIVLSPVFMLVGWALAAGRKELVLFLRRFGNEALNDSVRDLVQTVLRKRARLVTLDDSAFVPLGPRWRGLAVSLIPSGIVLGAIGLGYAEFAKVAQSELEEETPFGTALALIQLGIAFIGLVAGLTAILLFAAALRARFLDRMVVHDDSSRARVLKRLRKLRSLARAPMIAAPMATVVSVTDPEWQATVASMARMCDVTLIDISQPREAIRWELATLLETHVRIVLLAQREALARWWSVTRDDVDGRLAAELRSLAAGLPLVRYDEPDRLNETDLLKILSEAAARAR